MWGKYFIIRGIADSVARGGTTGGCFDGGSWLLIVLVVVAVLAAIVYAFIYVVLPVAFLGGVGYLLYRIIRKIVALIKR